MKELRAALLVAAVFLAVTALPHPGEEYEFKSGCREPVNITVVRGEHVMVISTTKCCNGFVQKENLGCVPENETSPCGNLTCEAVPDAHCEVFRKCGKEVALFMYEGSVASQCHGSGAIADVLTCSGGCVQDPCANTNCPAFASREVFCFTSGCDCQARWIHLEDQTEVNCLSGESISMNRKRRQRCAN